MTILTHHHHTRRLNKIQPLKADGNQASGPEHFLVERRTIYGIGITTRIKHLNDRAMTGNGFAHPSPLSLGPAELIRGRRDEMKMMIGEKAPQILGQ